MRRSLLLVPALTLLACPSPSTSNDGGALSAPAGLVYTPASLTCRVGTSCALLGPANAGGRADTFASSPALPMGLTLDPASGAVSGVPSVASAKGDYLVTATNVAGSASVVLSVAVVDVAPSALAYSTSPAVYEKGTAITANTPTVHGTVDAWTIAPSLPAGLAFNGSTGVITGTPTAVSATATYTVTATNSGGSATVSLDLTVNDVKPSALAYATNPAVHTQGQPITANVASNQGGAVVTWSVQPALPAGLSLDASTGLISGTPTALSSAANYTVTATNSGGSATVKLSVAVVAVAPSSLVYASNPVNYTQGVAAAPNQPMVAGGAVTSWGVMPPLPAGLSLDASTGVISGTPMSVSAVAMYTVTATNTGGSTMATLVLAVRPPAPVITTPSPRALSIPSGTRAELPVAATGTGALTYQWLRNGTPITGATTATYATPALTLADSGAQYTVAVSDSFGNITTGGLTTVTVSPATFTSTGSPGTKRGLASAALLTDGQVLVTGGYNLNGLQTSAERYNPTTGQFSTLTGSQVASRVQTASAVLPSGKVLLAGGFDFSASLNTAEVFDPTTNSFSATANTMNSPRRMGSAVVLKTGKVLVVGGGNFSPGTMPPVYANLQAADLYDPTANRFTATGALAVSRTQPCVAALSDGKVLVAGGSNPPSAEVYDPTAGTFSATAGAPTAQRVGSTCALLASGKVLIVGGNDLAGSAPQVSAELYDPATGRFTATVGVPGNEHAFGQASLLPSGKVLIIGGGVPAPGNTSVPTAFADLYDPVSDTFPVKANLLVPRIGSTQTVLPDGKVLIAGGESQFLPVQVFETTAELFW